MLKHGLKIVSTSQLQIYIMCMTFWTWTIMGLLMHCKVKLQVWHQTVPALKEKLMARQLIGPAMEMQFVLDNPRVIGLEKC